MRRSRACGATAWFVCLIAAASHGAGVFVEAESFADPGGWVVDQQFVDVMGSPYLLAHGYGRPVADARQTVTFPGRGIYRLWVRTKDWTAPLPDHPGSFKVSVGATEPNPVFGTTGSGWIWQDGGTVTITNRDVEIRLQDQAGFDGRCDALFFTTEMGFVPPNSLPELTAWRRANLGLPDVPPSVGQFDVVIVGGGLAGTGAAVAAARQGIKVALIQDRPVLGGNCSQDVRVHTLGQTVDGIVTEINTPDYQIGSDQFKQTDQERLKVVQAETNINLFLEWRAFRANTNSDTNGLRIVSIDARQTHTGEERRFTAPIFIDCTGDGWIGYWAGAQYRMGRESKAEFNESLAPDQPDTMTQGSTLSWYSRQAAGPVAFPDVPWATAVSKDYSQTRGDWYWEYGLTLNTIYDAEEIRDHLLRAIYGTFWNVKQNPANANLTLGWVGWIAGKRESRRLMGDYILTEHDVRSHPDFPDAVVMERREINLHYPQGGAYDFLTYAQYTSIADYWIPFRCLYSTNVLNLMMAGRCLSATHAGLGSPRVMNTGGQMGVATGTAAALCTRYGITPRGVYQRFAPELQTLMGISPAFSTPTNTVAIIDDTDPKRVTITGDWTPSTYQSGYYGVDYIHDGNIDKGSKSVRFTPVLPVRGDYHVYVRWTSGSSRATNAPVDIIHSDGTHTVYFDETTNNGVWVWAGTYPFELGNAGSVLLRTDGTTGHVIADAVAFAAAFPMDPKFTGVPWQDDDGDGVCNYAEWLNGTDPLDPRSYLRIELDREAGGTSLRFVRDGEKWYTIQYCESLASGSWQKLMDLEPSGLTEETTITDSSPNRSRFYRLVTPQVP